MLNCHIVTAMKRKKFHSLDNVVDRGVLKAMREEQWPSCTSQSTHLLIKPRNYNVVTLSAATYKIESVRKTRLSRK